MPRNRSQHLIAGARLAAVLVALAAAVTLASVAAAGPAAAKQRVQIDTKAGTFTLTALQAGAIESDSGTEGCDEEPNKRGVRRDGQDAWVWECPSWTFVGKRGKLVLRSQFTWIEAGGPYNIATGTWKVVRGTGQDAGITGGGRSAHVGSPSFWRIRYQGFITSP